MTRRIDVVTSEDSPQCPSCAREALLSARVPYGWTNTVGERVQGYSGVVLCPECDAQRPHAAPLITWFHVNGQANDEDAEFVELLVAWATTLFVPEIEQQAPGDELDRWRRSNL